MPTVVVFGAGPIGAAAAHALCREPAVRRVVLVDPAASVAQGLALDIRQSLPVRGATAAVEGSSDVSAALGAAAIVVADAHAAGEWRGDPGLALLTSVRALNPRAPIVCAGLLQADLVEAAVRERDLPSRLLVGSAPEAARGAATALVALEAGASAREVSLAVVGRPPDALFAAWDGAAIAGSRATDVLQAPAVARLELQIARLRPGPLALAGAAAAVVGRQLRRAPGWACLFLVPTDRGPAAAGLAVPASFETHGVRPEWPVLSPRDRTRLDTLSRR